MKESKAFICGHCSKSLASNICYRARSESSGHPCGYIYICHFCSKPNFFSIIDEQVPGALFGDDVDGISDPEVKGLYDQARKCMSVNAHAAAVMCGRKILMHIAVDLGASQGKKYAFYVQYLVDNHHIPPSALAWVDAIRDLGNMANHEIKAISDAEAERLVSFIEMLLKLIYEFPSKVSATVKVSS